MKAQMIRTKMIQTNSKMALVVASTWMLTACGGGFGSGGSALNLVGNAANQVGSEFSNFSSNVGSAGDDSGSHSPSSADVLALISAPVTEAEAFKATDATHTANMRNVAMLAGNMDGLTTFDQLSSTGPAVAAPSSDPYGGVAPPPPVVDPISNPPTGVDNPDVLPTLQSSAAKKGSVATKMVELIQAGRANMRNNIPAAQRPALIAEMNKHSASLQKLNMTNLSAETQSLIQANIVVFEAMAAELK